MLTHDEAATFQEILRSFARDNINSSPLLQQWQENKKELLKYIPMKVKKERQFGHETEITDFVKKHQFTYNFPSVLRELDTGSIVSNRLSTNKVINSHFFQKGTRLTKVMKTLFPNEKDSFNRFYSSFLYPIKLEGDVFLSVHPIDFITISINQHNWTTCHNLNEVFKGGSLSFLTDSTTFLAYIAPDKLYKYDSFEWNSKEWAVICHIDLLTKNVVIKESYPFSDPAITEEVINFIKKVFDITEEKRVEGRDVVDYYKDIDMPVHCTRRKDLNLLTAIIGDSSIDKKITVGNNPICLYCGEYYIHHIGSFGCWNCSSGEYCCTCAQPSLIDELLIHDTEYYCEDCYDRLFNLCESCGFPNKKTREYCVSCGEEVLKTIAITICEEDIEPMTVSIYTEENSDDGSCTTEVGYA